MQPVLGMGGSPSFCCSLSAMTRNALRPMFILWTWWDNISLVTLLSMITMVTLLSMVTMVTILSMVTMVTLLSIVTMVTLLSMVNLLSMVTMFALLWVLYCICMIITYMYHYDLYLLVL